MEDKKSVFLPYKVIRQAGFGEYIEKKSRFIANVAMAESTEEAASFIDSMRKKYYDARHHCSAFVIGRNKEITRCNDDGEPGGTAGKPILEVINGAEMVNTVIVVTRYFGGTLLGTGGLVRAYTEAARAGLLDAGFVTMRYGASLSIKMDYTDLGKVQYLLGSRGISILDSHYTDKTELIIRCQEEKTDALIKEITECTGARAVMEILEKGYYQMD